LGWDGAGGRFFCGGKVETRNGAAFWQGFLELKMAMGKTGFGNEGKFESQNSHRKRDLKF
jgi:hypothetical protein